MSSTTSIGIVVGAALSNTFGRTFKKANKSAFELGKAYRTTDKKLQSLKGVEQLRGRLGRLEAAQKKAGGGNKRLAEKIKATRKELWAASKAADKMGLSLGDITREQAKLNRLRKMQGFGQKAVGALPGIRSAAMSGLAGAGSMFALATSTASRGDDIAKTADKLGMGIEALQEYQYAADRSGVSQEKFNMATQRMVRRVAEAAQGTGEAVKALDELGINADYLASLSPEQQMEVLADAMKGTASQGDRVRLAMKFFDSEGVDLVNMLKDGSDGLRELRNQARDTGNVIGGDAVREGEKFTDTLTDTKAILAGLKNTIGVALLPVVGSFLQGINENREGLISIGTSIGSVIENVGGLGTIAAIVGGVLITKLLFAIKAIGLAIAANPIGALVTGLVIGATLIITHWDKVKSFMLGVFEAIGKAVKFLWKNSPIGKLVSGIQKVGTYFGGENVDEVVQPKVAAAQRSTSVQTTNHNQISVNAAPGMNEVMVGEEVRRQLSVRDREMAAEQRGLLYD